MGSSEYKNKAINEGAKPRPTKGMKMVNSAKAGKVRKTEVMASESSLAKTLRRVRTPSAIEKTLARPRTLTTYKECSRVLS
jgi:hypothetical protein